MGVGRREMTGWRTERMHGSMAWPDDRLRTSYQCCVSGSLLRYNISCTHFPKIACQLVTGVRCTFVV